MQPPGELAQLVERHAGLREDHRMTIQNIRGISSVGRALAWHAIGHRFDSGILHKAFLRKFFFMLFHVYILYSKSIDQYYIGHTAEIHDRLFRHNNSGSKSTKKANDWKLFYKEEFLSRAEAIKRELEIKKKKSRKYVEWLISSVG